MGRKKAADADAGQEDQSGHNIRITKKAAADFAKRYNNILDDLETYRGERMSEAKDLLEEMSNTLGVKRSVARTVLAEQRREKKRAEKEKDLEPSERDQLSLLRDKLGTFADLPLGQAAVAAAEAGA